MSSTLYNSAALSALQALNMTQQSLNTVQNQVSTGLAVATAADNSSYWSVAAELNQDNGIVTASNTALTEGQSMLSTANSAISSVITTLNSMATALTEAQNSQRQLRRHQHLARLARRGAHRRRQQRLVQWPQHPERHCLDDRRRNHKRPASTSSPATTRRPTAGRSTRSGWRPRRCMALSPQPSTSAGNSSLSDNSRYRHRLGPWPIPGAPPR